MPKASLEEALNFAPERSADIIALDDALNALAAIDERKCRIIELRFFGGFSWKRPRRPWDLASRPSDESSGWRKPGYTGR